MSIHVVILCSKGLQEVFSILETKNSERFIKHLYPTD
jgi:hypothetical protein